MRQAFNAASLATPAFRYSHVVKVGPHIYLSGLLAQVPETGALEGTTVGAQADRILQNLQAVMQELALDFSHLAMARIFTTAMERFSEINAAWEAVFNALDVRPPARTSIGVAALPMGALVEMEFTFYREG